MFEFLTKLWKLTRPYRPRLLLGVGMGIVAGLIEPLLIFTVAFVFGAIFPTAGGSGIEAKLQNLPNWLPDGMRTSLQNLVHEGLAQLHEAMAGDAQQHLGTVLVLVSLIPAVMALRALFTYLNIYLLQWTAVYTITDLRVRLFSHLLSLSTGFFAKNPSGDLMSRVVNDTMVLHLTISSTISVIVADPVRLIGLMSMLLWAQPKLTLVAMLVLPVCVVPIAIYGRKARRSARAIQESASKLSQVMAEGLTGNRVVKAYNLEPTVTAQFQKRASYQASQYLRLVRAGELPGSMIEVFGAIGIALVFLYLLWDRSTPRNAEQFLLFVSALFVMYRPMKNLTKLHNQVTQAQAASARVFELLAEQNNVPEPAQPKPLHAAGAEIHFDHVDFAYGEKVVLQGINLRVKPGQLVALVGATGSGKTTMANLLLRFEDPKNGAIRIGNTDLREVSSLDLRNQIAVVTQETILFNETIRRNIELGRPGATEDEIVAAAKHAYAHDFIMSKPLGYDNVVGEKGVTLSGGQRQRIAIARAVVRNAPILILDEATSALDTESERAVQSALDELMKGRTTLCIAHRLSTIVHADLIVVMDQGRIVETGTHDELVRRGGIYQKLYDLQFKV
jgi:ATP-binding cassette, subfamily B, bacterial MsbA